MKKVTQSDILRLLYAGLALLIIISSCSRKERNNPLDSKATNSADPFALSVSQESGGILVKWNVINKPNLGGYRISRAEQADDAGGSIGTVSSGTTFTDNDVWYEKKYWYRVSALDKEGKESIKSAPDTITVIAGAQLGVTPALWSLGPSTDSVFVKIKNALSFSKFSWNAVADQGWLILKTDSGAAGDSLNLKALDNSTTSTRTGHVVITATGIAGSPDTITVTQAPSGQQIGIRLSIDSWRAPGLGGSSEAIVVTSEGTTLPLSFVVISGANWLSIDFTAGTTPGSFIITAGDNFTGSSRNGWVTVQANGISDPPDTLYIYQPTMSWQPLNLGLGGGSAYALVVFDNELIVGGTFESADDIPASHIAAWNGVQWQPLALGIRGGFLIRALTVYNNKLVACGIFDSAGTVAVRNIAIWDGISWDSLLSLDSLPHAMASFDGLLFVGGRSFTFRWMGTYWYDLGFNDGQIDALSAYENSLIAGGMFGYVGGVLTNNIARWNNTYEWQSLGSGMDGPIWALVVYKNMLIAGGSFTSAGGIQARNIACWNGSEWQPLGLGLNDAVTALTVFDDELIAGGYFTSAGDSTAMNIARWNGSMWKPMRVGMNNLVRALAVFNGELYAAGAFTTAGGVSANNIAVLREQD